VINRFKISGDQISARRRCHRPSPLAAAVLLLILSSFVVPHAPAQAADSVAHTQAAAPIVLSLHEAIARAQASEPSYVASQADSRSASLDSSIARAGLLPSAVYHNQGLYTQANGLQNQAGQGTGSQPSPKFIANNAVREYASQAVINETFGLAGIAAVHRADAEAARAKAELEVARRGLVSTVTGLYYAVEANDNKLAIAQRAQTEAADFTSLTQKREQGREAAHADVVKAQLLQQQRDRDLSDARLAAEKSRLELAVLLFPDPRTPFQVAPAGEPSPLATRDAIDSAAANNNPELKSALAALKISDADVLAARAAYLPDLGLNYTYGIDAPQFAVNGPDHVRNLGYSASVTVDIPVWDWLATEHKVRQSAIRRDAARVALTAAQRRLIAHLDEAWSEATAARDQLASLDASVATATESLRLTRLRYSDGEATVLEVVDAQTAFVGAANARQDGRTRYQLALADLQTLTGTMQ
jgi:outer membrane protein TolC